jgi:hypothetical protein
VAEAQGIVIGNDLVVVSGFFNGFDRATAQTFALDTIAATAVWRRMDDLPVPEGITHAAFVVVGAKLYMCGGYIGGHPGLHVDNCLIYNHAMSPGSGQQWSSFAPLPDGGRAGGGMVYDTARDTLYFAAGAQRPIKGNPNADDYNNTWKLSLSNPADGWVSTTPIPIRGNHMSFVTARDATGKERHYFLGGQLSENECCGNIAENYEFDAVDEVWIRRQAMPFTRGHAGSSTRAIGCGFIIAGGTTNGSGKISDVSYYDIPKDEWIRIGDLTLPINTPVCDHNGGYLYCETGRPKDKFSWRRQITLS